MGTHVRICKRHQFKKTQIATKSGFSALRTWCVFLGKTKAPKKQKPRFFRKNKSPEKETKNTYVGPL